jgi:hypothetical protein
VTDEQGRYEPAAGCDCAGLCWYCEEMGCATCRAATSMSRPWFVKAWRKITTRCTECVRCLDTCDMTTRGPGETVVECVNCDACRYCDCPKSYEPGSEGHEVARNYQAQRLVDLEGNSNGK